MQKRRSGMSWYVNFYLGIMDKEKKIKPLGPFDMDGELCCVRSTSRSFTTDLHERFDILRREQFTDDLCKKFAIYTDEGSEFSQLLGYLDNIFQNMLWFSFLMKHYSTLLNFVMNRVYYL